jgi:hypothetical protein
MVHSVTFRFLRKYTEIEIAQKKSFTFIPDTYSLKNQDWIIYSKKTFDISFHYITNMQLNWLLTICDIIEFSLKCHF